jgi:hypothetical protein
MVNLKYCQFHTNSAKLRINLSIQLLRGGRNIMKWIIVLVLVMFACPAVQAEIFEWIDGQGVVHFTDDLDKVPAKFRGKVQIKTPGAGRDGGATAEKVQPPGVAAPPPNVKKQLYGGHDENWWRSSFNVAQGELKKLQDQLAEKNQSLTELHRKRVIYQKPSDRVAYNALAEEISGDEEKLKALQAQFAALQAEADNAGVPQEWRH